MSHRNSRIAFLVGSFAILSAPTFAQTSPGPQSNAAEAPVTLEGQTLFTVHTSLGPFSADERAAATSARLLSLAKDLTVPVNAIAALPSDTSTDIVARDRVILTITDGDAQAARTSRPQLASSYIAIIRSAIARRRAQYSYRTLAMGALYSLLATGLLIALLWSFTRIFRAVSGRLEERRLSVIRSIRLQRVELISADRMASIMLTCLKLCRAVLVSLALYVYAPLVLSFFPWTREYAPVLFGYIVDPLRTAVSAFASYLPSLIVVIVACLIAYGCTRLSRFLFSELAKGTITWSGFFPEWAEPTHKIVRFLILAFTAVVIFPYLPGSESPAFRGISIFLGVLFSLGSTSAVANIVAGTILTYTRAFQIGDRVKIADTTGDVIGRSLLATQVQTIKNEVVTVPNALVLGSHITNFSSSQNGRALILHATVTIGYDAPWRTVHNLLIAAALRTTGILKDPQPFVLQTGLDDFYVHYQINGYTKEPSRMANIYAELYQNIQDCFNEAGVEILSPHFSSLRDGNRKGIPDDYLPKNYTAPAFHIAQDRARAAATNQR